MAGRFECIEICMTHAEISQVVLSGLRGVYPQSTEGLSFIGIYPSRDGCRVLFRKVPQEPTQPACGENPGTVVCPKCGTPNQALPECTAYRCYKCQHDFPIESPGPSVSNP